MGTGGGEGGGQGMENDVIKEGRRGRCTKVNGELEGGSRDAIHHQEKKGGCSVCVRVGGGRAAGGGGGDREMQYLITISINGSTPTQTTTKLTANRTARQHKNSNSKSS